VRHWAWGNTSSGTPSKPSFYYPKAQQRPLKACTQRNERGVVNSVSWGYYNLLTLAIAKHQMA
jgi:hypothetical protein